jgi:hypothetical protein
MTLLSVLLPVADIVMPPPTPPPSHALPMGSAAPYLVLTAVAIGVLWLLRKGRTVAR